MVSLHPAQPFINSPHSPRCSVAPITCWDPNWYTEPRYFDWLTVSVTGHNLESQWGHCFFQKILYKKVTAPVPTVAEIARKFDPDYSTRWLSGKESTYQCKRCRRCWFHPWVGKIPGGGNGNLPQPGKFYGQRNLVGYNPWGCKGQTRLSTHIHSINVGTSLSFHDHSVHNQCSSFLFIYLGFSLYRCQFSEKGLSQALEPRNKDELFGIFITLNKMNDSLLVFSIDFIYFLVCLYEKPLLSRFFFFFLNWNCCELSQGPRIWLEIACEIDIFLFKM